MQLFSAKISIISCILICVSVGWKPRKPRILIIGDSISLGYNPFVQADLEKKADIFHNPGNAQHTATGLNNIEKWIANDHWDVIQFNWGLWDLCYRKSISHNDSTKDNRDKITGFITSDIKTYGNRLDSIVTILQRKTKAKLIFVTTSYVPYNEPGRYYEDAVKYNNKAKIIMARHGVIVNDIYKQSKLIHNQYGLGSDNVHYTSEGYKRLGLIVSKFLEQQIL